MEATKGASSDALRIIELLDVTIHSGGILASNVDNTPNPFAMSGDFFPIIETTLIPQHIIFSLAECFCLHNNPMPRAWRLRNDVRHTTKSLNLWVLGSSPTPPTKIAWCAYRAVFGFITLRANYSHNGRAGPGKSRVFGPDQLPHGAPLLPGATCSGEADVRRS